jgi:hypothetical protein
MKLLAEAYTTADGVAVHVGMHVYDADGVAYRVCGSVWFNVRVVPVDADENAEHDAVNIHGMWADRNLALKWANAHPDTPDQVADLQARLAAAKVLARRCASGVGIEFGFAPAGQPADAGGRGYWFEKQYAGPNWDDAWNMAIEALKTPENAAL